VAKSAANFCSFSICSSFAGAFIFGIVSFPEIKEFWPNERGLVYASEGPVYFKPIKVITKVI
jgi:hypothetical protein